MLSKFREKKKAEKLYVEEIFPIASYDENLNVGVLSDGTYVDVLQIVTTDLNNANPGEIYFINSMWDKLYRLYADDLKIISINFPTDTQEPQNYFKRKIDSCKNPVHKETLENEIETLNWIHENRMDREYYLVYFSKNKTELKEHFIRIYTTLSGGTKKQIQQISQSKKQKIIFLLSNKNTPLWEREDT